MNSKDRIAAFELIRTEEERQRAGRMPSQEGANFKKAGPRPIRPERLPRRLSLRLSVGAWLALSFFIPFLVTLVRLYLKG